MSDEEGMQAESRATEYGYDRLPRFPRKPLPPGFCNLERLLKMMEQRGLDGIVSSFRRNVFYLTGFSGNPAADDFSGGVVVVSRHYPDHAIGIVPEPAAGWFLTQPSWITDIRPYQTDFLTNFSSANGRSIERFIPVRGRDTELVNNEREHYAANRMTALRTAIKELGLDRGRVGFDQPQLGQQLLAVSPVEPVDAYGALKYVRQVKTETELSVLRTAAAVNQAAIASTVASWTPGMTWNELNLEYDTRAVNLGGFVRDPGGLIMMNDEASDPLVVMVQRNGVEDDFAIQPGTAIMFDCHGSWNHYCWDGGNTWYVADDIPVASRTVAEAAGNGMIAAFENMKPGLRVSQMQAVVREALAKTGINRPDDVLVFFHGVGLDHNELETPAGSEMDAQRRYDWVLESGMVVAAHIAFPGEPDKRYYIEDTVVVTEHGGDPFFTWGVEPLVNKK